MKMGLQPLHFYRDRVKSFVPRLSRKVTIKRFMTITAAGIYIKACNFVTDCVFVGTLIYT